jgi:hypothetical protein
MQNPWNDFDYTTGRQVHPADLEAFEFFNEKIKKSKSQHSLNYLLQDHVSPQPYFGNKDGKLLILLANPAYLEGTDVSEETPEIRRLFDLSRKHSLDDAPFVYLRQELQATEGYDWWAKKLRVLIEHVGLDAVTNQVFSVEWHAYKSKNYRRNAVPFASQEYTQWLVKKAMDNDSFIVVGRSQKEWFSAVPGLADYPKFIRLNSVQNASITPNNMQPGRFNEIVEAIRLAQGDSVASSRIG